MNPARPVFALAPLMALALGACAPDQSRFYQGYTSLLLEQGGLRSDYDPADAPFDNAKLVQDFETVAFYSEFRKEEGPLVMERTQTVLSRWNGPVYYALAGDGVLPEDREAYRALAATISARTGLEIYEAGRREQPDIKIFILTSEERDYFRELAEKAGVEEKISIAVEWTKSPLFPCVGTVYSYDDEDSGVIDGAMIYLKSELEGKLRTSCIHEEFSQTFGLLNDGDDVRPSIFNDDQEFAALTRHDELLLAMLYDERLRPGMTLAEARPLLKEIADEVNPEGVSH